METAMWAAALVYALSALFGLYEAFRPTKLVPRLVLGLLQLGSFLHAIAVAINMTTGRFLTRGGLHDGLSLFTLAAVVLALWVAYRRNMPQVAILSAPLVGGLALITAALGPEVGVRDLVRSPLLTLHIGMAILGDAAAVVAGLVSLMYLLQERRLKQKRTLRGKGDRPATGLQNLPALEILDGLQARLLLWGFPLMTLGLVLGSVYAKEVWGRYWVWDDPRLVVSSLVWLLYAVMLHARLMVGWRGRKAAILTVVGVVAILLAFLGFGLLGIGHHARDVVA